MLQLYLDAGGKVCQTAGYKFINDRLIQLMKDAMIEYVEFIPSYQQLERLALRQPLPSYFLAEAFSAITKPNPPLLPDFM